MTPYSIPIYRVALVRDPAATTGRRLPVTDGRTAATVIMDYLKGVDREHCVVLMLDAKNRIIGINTVSTGNLTSSMVHPREVFKPAILSNAAAIIIAHNHPSDDTDPSPEDNKLTKRLKEAGALLGITLLDHIIICDMADKYYSYADRGTL